MVYTFKIGGRQVTVDVTTQDTNLGKVDTFGIQVTMRDGGAALGEYMAPTFGAGKRGTEGYAKYYARMFVRTQLATYERNIAFGWHDYTINRRCEYGVYTYPAAYKAEIMQVVKSGSIKGTRKMIEQAGEEWLS